MFAISLLQPAGVDLFCLGKKFLVFNMVSRNLKSKYRRSFFGFFWTILSPLSSAVTFYFVFKVVMKIQIPHYLVFILSGMLFWNFFVQSVLENMESLVGSLGLLTKIPIPIQVFPYVGCITNLVTLMLATPIVIGAALFSHIGLGPSLVLLPFYFVMIFLMNYGLSLVLAVAFVYLRDLRHLMTIFMQIWFYLTPVVYSETMIPERFKWVLYANPVAPIFMGVRSILMDGSWPSGSMLLASVSWTAFMLGAAIVVRKYFCKELVELL